MENPVESFVDHVKTDVKAAVEKDLGGISKLPAELQAIWPTVAPLLAKVNWVTVLADAGVSQTEVQTIVSAVTQVLTVLKSV